MERNVSKKIEILGETLKVNNSRIKAKQNKATITKKTKQQQKNKTTVGSITKRLNQPNERISGLEVGTEALALEIVKG